MNAVPLLFAEDVVRLICEDSLCSLQNLSPGPFESAGRSLWENRLEIFLNVFSNRNAGNFDYCLTCTRNDSCEEAYTYDPADSRFVTTFKVFSVKIKHLNVLGITWKTAAPSDPTLLWWLRAPFAQTWLHLDVDCPHILNLLPDYCSFSVIYAFNDLYNKALDEIIQKCRRLEYVHCTEFFKKRGRKKSIEWIATNKRLRCISGFVVDSPVAIGNILDKIGVLASNRRCCIS